MTRAHRGRLSESRLVVSVDRDSAEREAMDALRLFQLHQGRDEELALRAQQQWLRSIERLTQAA